MIIDTHAHLLKKYYDDLESEIEKVAAAEIIIFNSGVDPETNKEVIELAKKYDNIFATVGFHPTELANIEEKDLNELEKDIQNKKVVAIGEIGLDYYHDQTNKEKQIEIFKKQILLAKKYHKPIIVHTRNSLDDVYNILKESKLEQTGGIIHCYSGNTKMAKNFIKLGFLIGIGGVVTFKNATELKKVVEDIDIKSIVVETDAPYLAPTPYRGKKNTSRYLPEILKELEKIKKMPYNNIVDILEKNVHEKFFKNMLK